MKRFIVLVLAASSIAVQGNPLLKDDEELDTDGSGDCTPPVPPVPTTGGGSGPATCGERPLVVGSRIVGGHETPKHSLPWQAMLRNDAFQFCAGSLIHKRWVLTAAHCVEGEDKNSFKIWLGAHRIDTKEDVTQEMKVAQIVIHPKYDFLENDIALIKLETEAVLGKGVGLVCLGDDKFHLPLDDLNQQCLTSGWGTLESGGNQPDKLQEVMLPLVSHSICKKAYSDLDEASMLCAGFKQGGKDSCQGDSGGPLVCQYSGKYYLEGATSFGNGCAAADAYGVYAKIRSFRKFIDSTIGA